MGDKIWFRIHNEWYLISRNHARQLVKNRREEGMSFREINKMLKNIMAEDLLDEEFQ